MTSCVLQALVLYACKLALPSARAVPHALAELHSKSCTSSDLIAMHGGCTQALYTPINAHQHVVFLSLDLWPTVYLLH